jgi:hypothetical protein
MTDKVIQIVQRANQRGGRMLSVVDLIEAGTLSTELAAWLLAQIRDGASFLVGAQPGGAGKTAIMGALLTMLPDTPTVYLTGGRGRWTRAEPGSCLVAYEISPASYEAYIWGEAVQKLTELGRNGARIVSNLHADTLEEARDQVVDDCGAGEEGFRAFTLFIPINTGGRGFRMQRVVEEVYLADESGWRRIERGAEPEAEGRGSIERFLERCLKEQTVRIEDVRSAWLAFLRSGE